MLRPLILLFAVIAVPGAAVINFNTSTGFDISSCPITFYGVTYSKIFVNVTADRFVICFGDNCTDSPCIDMIRGPTPDAMISEDIVNQSMILDILIKNALNIPSSLDCFVSFALGNNFAIYLVKYGKEAVVSLNSNVGGTTLTNITANGTLQHILSVTNTKTNGEFYDFVSVIGCRYEGVVYKAGTTQDLPDTCETLNCNSTGGLSVVSNCKNPEICLGDDMCVIITTTPTTTTTTPPPTTTPTTTTTTPPPTTTSTTTTTTPTTTTTTPTTTTTIPTTTTTIDSICTVTGPSVIDFSSHLDFVKDLCEHYLLNVEGLSVVGNFRDRRRRTVSFLDSVWLTVKTVNIHLEQGGRVVMNGTPLDLSSSPKAVGDGVTVSKDHTGVTVVVQIQDLEITVFFDGYTAHILVKGSTGSPREGLCKDSSSVAKLPNCSSISCVPRDGMQEEMVCPNNTLSCNYLNETTSCDINKKPYLDACKDLLSRYPAVDGLKCQFLTAYAKACSLYRNITVDNLRSKSKCHHHGTFCHNKTCNDHEFCAEADSGDNRCFCRANFACEIRNDNTYGHAPVCKRHHASLTLYICMLEEQNINYTSLRLNDPTCKGELNVTDNTLTFTFEGDTCGTVIQDNSTHIIYKNTIMSQNVTEDIIRSDVVMIDFSCYQIQPNLQTTTFTIMNNDYKGVIVPGAWNYTLFIKAYIDDGCTKLVDSTTQIKLNQQVWVKLITKGLDEDLLVLVTDHCWATDTNAVHSHDLINNGLPADPTVVIRDNGKETSNAFAFNMFEFTRGSNQIDLHCEVHLCVKSTNMCEPKKRRRRSARSEHHSPGLISMGWSS